MRSSILWLGVAMALAGCRGQISKQPPIHLNPNMDQQRRIDPQEPSRHFADGRGNRGYPEGTVRFAYKDGTQLPCELPEANPLLCEGSLDGGGTFTATLPPEVPLTEELLARGEARYDIYCAPCHDAAGTANGTVARRGMTPVSFHTDFLRSKPVGSIYKTITHGGAVMPPYAAQIPVEDRWAIAAWVKALQLARHASRDEVPADVAASNGWN